MKLRMRRKKPKIPKMITILRKGKIERLEPPYTPEQLRKFLYEEE